MCSSLHVRYQFLVLELVEHETPSHVVAALISLDECDCIVINLQLYVVCRLCLVLSVVPLLKGKPCHVNLIRLNEVKERDLKSTGDKDAYRFLGWLEKGGLSATLRRQIGVDIGGACGQLRASYLS